MLNFIFVINDLKIATVQVSDDPNKNAKKSALELEDDTQCSSERVKEKKRRDKEKMKSKKVKKDAKDKKGRDGKRLQLKTDLNLKDYDEAPTQQNRIGSEKS
ncbi:MAG: hypothetical protein QM706_05765 [Nitrospira sp.]